MVDEVPIGEAEHKAIPQRSDGERALGLWNTITAAASAAGGRDGHYRLQRFGRVCRSGKIHLHAIKGHAIRVDRGENPRSTSGRWSESIQIGGRVAALPRDYGGPPGGGRMSPPHTSG